MIAPERPRVKLRITDAELATIRSTRDSARVLDSAIGRACASSGGFRRYYVGLSKDERRSYRRELATELGLTI